MYQRVAHGDKFSDGSSTDAPIVINAMQVGLENAEATISSHTAAIAAEVGRATTAEGLALAKAANLSDLANAATARTNLGLGSAAVATVGTTPGTVAAGDDTRFVTQSATVNSGTSYTLALIDLSNVLELTAATAVAVTVPPHSSVAFPVGTIIELLQAGAGTVTVVAGAGVTIRTPTSLTTRTQWSSAMLRQRATDEWVITGDMT